MENRTPTPAPARPVDITSFTKYPQDFERYVNDSFGMRSALLHGYNFLLSTIGVSGSKQVVIGRDGWLFIGNTSIKNLQGREPLKPSDTPMFCKKMEARAHNMRDDDILFIVVIVPDKQTVYSEFMPYYLRPSINLESSQLETLMIEIENHVNFELLDLRQAMHEAKYSNSGAYLYHKTDTHWNHLGAYYGYRAIIERLAVISGDELPAMELSNYNISAKPTHGLGNSKQLGLEKFINEDENVKLIIKNSSTVTNIIYLDNLNPIKSRTSYSTNHKAPKILIFGDSFMQNIFPFMAESSEECTFVDVRKIGFDTHLIKKVEPDIVIYEFIERNIRMHSRNIKIFSFGAKDINAISLD